jgi:uncharacterized protein YjbJ (UPF0337 family)
MDENRTSGTAKNLGGKVEEGFARVTGDAKTKAQGQMKQAEGSIQDLYGQAVDAAEDTIDAVRKMPASLDDTIRHYIENNPYTLPSPWVSAGLWEGCTAPSNLLFEILFCGPFPVRFGRFVFANKPD